MAVDFTIKKDDQLPEMLATLLDANEDAVDISTAVNVKFIMVPKGGTAIKVEADATIVNAATGLVKYSWAEEDTDTIGNFLGEFEVEYGDGRLETFPNSTYINILVKADLGGVR